MSSGSKNNDPGERFAQDTDEGLSVVTPDGKKVPLAEHVKGADKREEKELKELFHEDLHDDDSSD